MADPYGLFDQQEGNDPYGLSFDEPVKAKKKKKEDSGKGLDLSPELDPHTGRAMAHSIVGMTGGLGPATMEFVRSGSLERAAEVQGKAAESVAYTPKDPEQAKKTARTLEAMDEVFVRQPGNLAVAASQKHPLSAIFPPVAPLLDPLQKRLAEPFENEFRMMGEIGGQFVSLGMFSKGAGRAAGAASKAAKAAEVDAKAYEQWKAQQRGQLAGDPYQLEFPDEVMRGRQQEAALADAVAQEELDRQAAKGEVEGVQESQAILHRELGQPDMFDAPITRTEEFPSSPAAPSLRSKERGPDITELPTEEVPGRAAPKLTEQELYGPVERRETRPATLDPGVTDERAKYEALMDQREADYAAKVQAFNERAAQLEEQKRQMQAGDFPDLTSVNRDYSGGVATFDPYYPTTNRWIETHPLLGDVLHALLKQAQEIKDNKRKYFSVDDEFKQQIKIKNVGNFEFVRGMEAFIPEDLRLPDNIRAELINGAQKRRDEGFEMMSILEDLKTDKDIVVNYLYERANALAYPDFNRRWPDGLASVEAASYKVRLGIDDGLKKFVEGNDYRGGLDYIREKHSDKYLQYLADQLLKDPNLKPSIRAVEAASIPEGRMLSEGNIVGGLYSGGKADSIQLSKIGGHVASAVTFLHEGLHSNLSRLLRKWELGQLTPRKINEGFDTINRLFQLTKETLTPEQLKQFGETGLHNVHEFITHAMTDIEFQQVLKDLRYRPQPGQGFLKNAMSAWDAFIETISSILGLDPKKKTHLSILMNEVAKIQREIRTNPVAARMNYGPDAIIQRQLVEDWTSVNESPKYRKSDAQPKSEKEFLDSLRGQHDQTIIDRFGKFMYEDYKQDWQSKYGVPSPQVGYDNRPHAEFRSDLFDPDGNLRIQDINHSWGPAYTESKRHPIIRRVYDAISQMENAISNVFDDLMRGQKIESGYGISVLRHGVLKESKDSVSYIASHMNKKTKAEVMDLFGRYGRSDPAKLLDIDGLAKSGASSDTVRFFKALKELGAESLKRLNDARQKAGLEPIKERPDWLVSFARTGKYHVYSIDPKTGKSDWRAGFADAAEAKKVVAHLQANGMDVRMADASADPRRFTLPPEAFYEGMRATDDPVRRKQLQEAVEEAIKKTGVRKYALARDSSAGGMPGSIEITEALGAERSFEHLMYGTKAYANSVANYVGSIDYSPRVNDLLYDTEIRTKFPNATAAGQFMYDSFRNVGDAANVLNKTISLANRAFTAANVVMFNLPFYLANAVQFSFAPPRMLETNATILEGKGNVTEASLKAMMRLYVDYDGKSRAIIKEAVDNGSLEARFAEALDFKMAESSWENAVRTITLHKAAAMSDSFARAASYMMFYELAKSAGKTDKLAHSFAARESQGVMVQYSKWARMPLLNKWGTVGDLASPLTQYISNLAFNVGQYMKMATVGDKKAGVLVGPLLAYLTAQTALSGVKGLPGYEDIDAGMMLLNKYYVEKFGGKWFGTPSELLNELGVGDTLKYGIPSAATNIHMSGTLGAGNMLPSFVKEAAGGDVGSMFPGVDYGYKLIDGASTMALNATEGVSVAEKEQAISQVAPGALKEWVREHFSDRDSPLEGRMVGGNKLAVYNRSGKENILSMITGKPSLDEAGYKKSLRLYETREAAVSAAKSRAIEQIVDSATKGTPMTSFTENVINNYPEVIPGLMDAVTRKLKARNVPFYERKLVEVFESSNMLDKARKVQTLEELFNADK